MYEVGEHEVVDNDRYLDNSAHFADHCWLITTVYKIRWPLLTVTWLICWWPTALKMVLIANNVGYMD